MIPFRFIHAADLHLDSPFAGMTNVPEGLRSYLRNSAFAALNNLVELAIHEQVDFIVIAGDVYDSADSSLTAQLRLREAWDRLGEHGITVYIIHGNHDPLEGRRLRMAHPQHVIEFGPEVESFIAYRREDSEPVAVISGISYPTAAVTDNLAARFKRDENSSLFHIALLHANVDGKEGHDAYAPCSLRELKEKGFDYWALGHIHKREILHTAPWVVYPGNIQGRSMKECGPKGCYVVEVEAGGQVSLHFKELDEIRWTECELSIDGLEMEEQLRDRAEELLEELREGSNGRAHMVRLVATGRGPLHNILAGGTEAEELLQELRRKEASRYSALQSGQGSFERLVWPVGIRIKTGSQIDRDSVLREDTFLGELLRLADQAAQDPEVQEELLASALAPLMEHRKLRVLLREMGPEDKKNLLWQASELAISLLSEEEAKGGEGR